MNESRQWNLRGGGHVTETFLPYDADLDALHPRRVQVAETRTGVAWVAPDKDQILLLLDERQSDLPEGKAVTVLKFGADEASRDVFVDVVSALIHENVRRPGPSREPEKGTGGTPAAPPAPPRPGTQPVVTVPVMQVWKVRTKYDA